VISAAEAAQSPSGGVFQKRDCFEEWEGYTGASLKRHLPSDV